MRENRKEKLKCLFSASYTSFLSVVNQAKPFVTINDLENTNFIVGSQAGTAFQMMFRVFCLPQYWLLTKSLIKGNTTSNN